MESSQSSLTFGSIRLNWPFQHISNSRYLPTGWVLLHGPIITAAQQEQFAVLRRGGFRFIGMCSYMTFPRPEPGDTLDYGAICEAWCHCFRNPEYYLSTGVPRALISASDFTDYLRVSLDAVCVTKTVEDYDFVYVGATEGWKREIKGWTLAGQLIPVICGELDLRALVIGRPTPDFPPNPSVSFFESLEWRDLLSKLGRARFLLVPNSLDPSPRLLAESLCMNVPIVVNRQILGGWKYVNPFTGAFFGGERDVIGAVRRCLARGLAPRDWFRANYGPYLAGARLLRLVRAVDAALTENSHLVLDE